MQVIKMAYTIEIGRVSVGVGAVPGELILIFACLSATPTDALSCQSVPFVSSRQIQFTSLFLYFLLIAMTMMMMMFFLLRRE